MTRALYEKGGLLPQDDKNDTNSSFVRGSSSVFLIWILLKLVHGPYPLLVDWHSYNKHLVIELVVFWTSFLLIRNRERVITPKSRSITFKGGMSKHKYFMTNLAANRSLLDATTGRQLALSRHFIGLVLISFLTMLRTITTAVTRWSWTPNFLKKI